MTLKDIIIAGKLTISEGGGGGGEYPYEYYLGGHCFDTRYDLQVFQNHVKYTGLSTAGSGVAYGLRNLPNANNQPEWFELKAGSVVEVTFKNIVNEAGIVWNANARKSNSSNSSVFGIGDGTHADGNPVIKTVTIEEDISIGSWFLYIATNKAGILEFDMEITVDGVRIL